MFKPILIGDFLHRIREPATINPDKLYSLVTVKLHHKGVVLREKKKGSLLGSTMHNISKGQFILSGIDARNGAFGVVPDELDGAIITNDFWCFDVDESKVKRDFFFWLTNTPAFLEACEKSSKGETQRIRLQKDLFYNFEFHFPPVEKQELFLGSLQKTSNALESLNKELSTQSEKLALLRQSILQEAIEGQLTAEWRKKNPVRKGNPEYDAAALLEKIKAEKQKMIEEGKIRKEKPLAPIKDEEKPFELPEGWVWCRLGNWGFTQTGSTPSTTIKEYFGKYIPFVKPADINNKFIGYCNEGLSKKGIEVGRLIAKGSILMVCIGGSIGKSYYTDRDVSCNQQINSITPLSGISASFLLNFMQSKHFQFEVADRAMKSSTPIINKGKWEEIPLPLPPLAEQSAIVSHVGRLLAMVSDLEKQVSGRKQQAEDLMQAVLREAFEGGKTTV